MRRKFYLFLLLGLLFTSCAKVTEEIESDNDRMEIAKTRSIASKDPYALSAMQNALDILAVENPEIRQIQLKPTDYYVRFLPADSIQMAILKNLNIQLFDHRLDIMPGDAAWEESIATNREGYDWIYAVVPVDFVFPEEIKYENIYGVFIQRPVNSKRRSTKKQLTDDLYQTALRKSKELTGNYIPKSRAQQEWQPSATLNFEIDSTQVMAIPGVTVRVYNYTYNENGWRAQTNDKGETGPICTISEYVQYEIIWENPSWELRVFQRAQIRVTKEQSTSYLNASFDVTLEDGTFDCVLAAFHRALYAYYYEQYPLNEGLTISNQRMYVGITDEVSDKEWQGTYSPGLNYRNPLRIFTRYEGDRMMTSKEALSSMFHELGHASHLEIKGIADYGDRSWKKSGESWANGVEYAYMKSIFPNNYKPVTQDKWQYTRVVEGLLNNGATFEQIQTAFRRSVIDWEDWMDEMIKLNVMDNDFVRLIFSHANDMIFDMRDVISVPIEEVYRRQPIWLSLNESAANHCKVSKWEILGDQTGATLTHSDSQQVSYSFSTLGKRTIRATVQFPDNYQKVYEKTITVQPGDIIINPKGTLYTFKEIKFSLQPEALLDSNINILKWWTDEPDGVLTSRDDNERYATFSFSSAGDKIVKVELDHPFLQPQSVVYECKIHVSDLPMGEGFEIINRPNKFISGSQYQASFIDGNRRIYDVTKVEMDHFTFLAYWDKQEWKYDKNKKILTFRLPDNIGVSVDYRLTIYYKADAFSPDTYTAKLIVSNVR